MIQENEIRVGNYFSYSEKHPDANCMLNIPMKWNSSDWYRVGECIDLLENYNPIQLTEEWLLKCGFVYRNEHRGLGAIMDFTNPNFDNYKYNKSVAFQHETNNENNIHLHFLQHATANNIKYLHQLQNLYFALTGEELTITF